ncbi:MAG: XRE family transcriptional regulator [Methylobacter sp.]
MLNNTSVLRKVNTPVVCEVNTFVLDLPAMRYIYGERLRMAREHRGLTQGQLAELSGVKQGTISKIERGDQHVSSFDIELAYALDIEAMWLKTGGEEFEPEWIKEKDEIKFEYLNKKEDLHFEPSIEYLPVRMGSFHLQAGIVGYTVDYMDEEKAPIFFRSDWFKDNGYKPHRLVACQIKGDSMEPRLFAGDIVIINLDDTTPADGGVFAINYEGEMVIKRLIRDAGAWHLQSDNPDKIRHPNKICSIEFCIPIGRVIYRQSKEI